MGELTGYWLIFSCCTDMPGIMPVKLIFSAHFSADTPITLCLIRYLLIEIERMYHTLKAVFGDNTKYLGRLSKLLRYASYFISDHDV